MGSGTGSTLKINPTGLASLTMTLGPNAGGTEYIVPLQTLTLNVDQRRAIVYAPSSRGDGGEAIGEFGPLIPVAFWVSVRGSTRATMLAAYHMLQAACLNPKGGTIQYKPEDLAAGVLDTYYHYVRSKPPVLLKMPANRWDAPAHADGSFSVTVEVELMTQPIATSDPDSPATLSEMADTLENWHDATESQHNHLTISKENVKGVLPALVRVLVTPASSQSIGRIILFTRNEGTLANFESVYEAEDASVIGNAAGWTSVADSARGDDNYMKCQPSEDANGYEQGLRFTIANIDDHKGRFAVFGVGFDDGAEVGVWTHQVKVSVGNVIQAGKADYEAVSTQTWQLVYAGEFELPPIALSAVETGYDSGPFIEWYATRASGTTKFCLDAIIVVYIVDSDRRATAIDIICADEGGIESSDKLLIENFPGDYGTVEEIAHVVASDDDFKRGLSVAPRGDFLTFDPTKDTLLVVFQERALKIVLDDDFSSYKAAFWLEATDFEDAGWAGARDGTDEREGTYALQSHCTSGSNETLTLSKEMDLSIDERFTNDDFIVVAYKMGAGAGGGNIRWIFWTSGGNYSYISDTVAGGGAWQFIKAKKSAVTDVGTAVDWEDVNQLQVYLDDADNEQYVLSDWWRIEKADPDDATNPNATGATWNFQPVGGKWTITEDITGAGATLACIDQAGSVEKSALIDLTTPNDVKFRANVYAKDDVGSPGIIWRSGQDTLVAGTEDCYAAVLEMTTDKLIVYEFNNGSRTNKFSPDFGSDVVVDTWYTIGVIVKGTISRVYATATANLTDLDDVFASSYLLATMTDGTFTSGQCGVMNISALGRFDEVKLVSLQDKMIPADTVTLSGKAIFRTIAPFSE